MIIFQQWFHVTGRGWIAQCVSDDPNEDISKLNIGEWIEIHEDRYQITGIETSCGMGGHDKNFGLVIRGQPGSGVKRLGKPIPWEVFLDC
jgi:hypothetical protein